MESANDTIGTVNPVKFEVPYLTFVCILGIIGNAIVLLVYTRQPFRKSNATLYILNLAVGDFLTITVVLFHITEFFPVTWPILWAHDWQCAVHRYLRFVVFINTVVTMMAIGVDRYYAVRKPMVFKLKFSLKRTKLLIVTLWCLAFVAALPTALMFQSFYAHEEEKSNYVGKSLFACKLSLPFGPWFEDFKAIYLNVVLFLIPVTITGYLFTCIVGYVWQNNREINVRFNNTSRSVRNSHWTTAKSLLAVFVVFLVCYCPFSTYNLFQRYIPNLLPATVKNVALLLPYANSCMNPVVYSFTSVRFRRYCARLLFPFITKTTNNLQHAFASGHSGSQKSDERHDHTVAYVFEPNKYIMDTKAEVQQL